MQFASTRPGSVTGVPLVPPSHLSHHVERIASRVASHVREFQPTTEKAKAAAEEASNEAVPVAKSSIVGFTSDVGSLPSAAQKSWKIRLLYDGDCPLCMIEVNMLKEQDAGQGNIDFVDISSESYNPEANQGVSFAEAMKRIHGILPDGTVVEGVEVLRRCYEAVGQGWVNIISKYEPVGKVADALYNVWSKYRLPITGREPLEVLLEKRKNDLEGVTCDGADSCELPFPPSKK